MADAKKDGIGLMIGFGDAPSKGKPAADEGSGEVDMRAARLEALQAFFEAGAAGKYEAADEAWADFRAAEE